MSVCAGSTSRADLRLTWTAVRRLLDRMAITQEDPPRPIIPTEPPPPPPGKEQDGPPPKKSVRPAANRDRRRSHPDVGDVRIVPRSPDDPLVISRRSWDGLPIGSTVILDLR